MYFAKALVAPAVAAALLILETVGVTPSMSVEEALTVVFTGLVTGALVYFIPNKK